MCAYPEIVPLRALIACNARNWPGGAALSFSHRFHHWLMLYTLVQYIVNVQWSTTSDRFLTIFTFGICFLNSMPTSWCSCPKQLIYVSKCRHMDYNFNQALNAFEWIYYMERYSARSKSRLYKHEKRGPQLHLSHVNTRRETKAMPELTDSTNICNWNWNEYADVDKSKKLNAHTPCPRSGLMPNWW